MPGIVPSKFLNSALEFEEKGGNFYSKTAAELAHPLSRKLFQTLAGDEARQAERLRAIVAARTQGAAWPAGVAEVHPVQSELKAFFTANHPNDDSGDWGRKPPTRVGSAAGALSDSARGTFGSLGGSTGSEALTHDPANTQGYEFAIQLEKAGIELYTKFARETADERERGLFATLILDKQSHLEALHNVHFFLAQPGAWPEPDENKIWTWMNP